MQETKNPEISIIIPVYNVEPYIRRCLDSIKAQTFTDFEAIIVDDSSPDGSIKIAMEFVASDSRFKIVTRENGGLSAARNTGIAMILLLQLILKSFIMLVRKIMLICHTVALLIILIRTV